MFGLFRDEEFRGENPRFANTGRTWGTLRSECGLGPPADSNGVHRKLGPHKLETAEESTKTGMSSRSDCNYRNRNYY
jgi:hypothetical protein